MKNWEGEFIETRLAIEELGRGIHPLGRNWNSGLVKKFTIEKFGEGSLSLGRNWNSGLVTKFTIEKFGEGSFSPN